MQEVASARGANAGGFIDKGGNIAEGEGNKLDVGATNSERANLNKTAGLGLQLTRNIRLAICKLSWNAHNAKQKYLEGMRSAMSFL